MSNNSNEMAAAQVNGDGDDDALLQRKPRMGMLTVGEKIEQAELLKLQANVLVKRGEFKAATTKYARVFAYVNGISTQGDAMAQYASRSAHMSASEAEGDAIQALKIACWSNMALCQLKLGHGERAVEFCDKVLAEDETHSKALFRKAQGLALLSHYDRAQTLLTQLAALEPQNAAVRRELKALAVAKKKYEQDARASSSFNNMFNKKGGIF
ncbi:hypothetical protein PINS_up014468 [Pythium insidiosum]|nr:hypothetical protein PINS_up014468 [Pythium insidiosum]